MRKEIEQLAVLYRKTTNRPLSEFQHRINDAAIQIAHSDPSLLRKGNRGEKARLKVAEDKYEFKKGASRFFKFSHTYFTVQYFLCDFITHFIVFCMFCLS